MEQLESATRRRTLDLPPKPEAGLAEWTTKIKALQRQVDEDEATEQKRLEQEIAASRAARLRRSAGYSSRSNSVDLPQDETTLARPSYTVQREDASEVSTADKQRNQDDALRKLMGENYPIRDKPTISSKTTSNTTPMSLAAFIGGRATGPRLTKHAPQQDAHEPTQFEQRLPNSSPHPVFGRGGIAMPGMTGRTGSNGPKLHDDTSPVTVNERDRKLSSPTTTEPNVVGAVDSHASGRSPAIRDRTLSTPASVTIGRTAPSPQVVHGISALQVYSPSLASQPPVSSVGSTTSVNQSVSTGQVSPSVSASPMRRSQTTFPITTSVPPSSSPKHPITTPSLSRPIHPSPRHSLGPQIPASQNPSPAFLRAPTPKEPTPSISRLQGRGFVQSVVKASSQFGETPAGASSPTPGKQEFGAKKNVLDRWQFTDEGNSPKPSPPIISPKPVSVSISKSGISDPPPSSNPTLPVSTPLKPTPIGRSMGLRSTPSLPLLSQAHQTSTDSTWDSIADQPGLGSSTTMISYIKSTKTGDEPTVPAPSSRTRTNSPLIDELGMRVGTKSVERESKPAWLLSSSPGKSLSHPTKDRAKKPRKSKNAMPPSGQVPTVSVIDPQVTLDDIKSSDSTERPSEGYSTAISQRDGPLQVDSPFVRYSGGVIQPSPDLSTTSRSAAANPSISPPSASRSIPGIRQPLPGLAASLPKTTTSEKSSSPVRHGRVPSTGNRAKVMDVALAFQEHKNDDLPHMQIVLGENDVYKPAPRSETNALVVGKVPQNVINSYSQADRRKSSYEKYSAFAMPPVKEETPVSTPTGTLSRTTAATTKMELQVSSMSQHNDQPEQCNETAQQEYVHIAHSTSPVPEVDVDYIFHTPQLSFLPNPDIRTITVDVLVVVGNTATAVSRDPHVFYDSEVLAIIHRFKAQSTGLVSTSVWAWHGARCQIGEREERKLQELVKRYGTTLKNVFQYREPLELASILGGKISTRQGTRAHWSSENTAMHVVRSSGGQVFIDELELHIRNLCSGFSYCLTLLGSVFVWYGCGSREEERAAALNYAKSLSSNSSSIIELIEGQNDNDEMFWMILGEGQYAKADYWKWKREVERSDPRIWCVDTKHSPSVIYTVNFFSDDTRDESVYVIDCIWEYFVLVGSQARAKRQDIYLALKTALALSQLAASSRPFTPPVHALVLPSQIPVDLLLTFRDMDEVLLNDGHVPEHMNLISAADGLEQLARTAWRRDALRDPTMLPLGVDISNCISGHL